jgi:hypothetical protein
LLNENTEEEIIEKIKDIFGKRELIAQIKKNLKKVKEEFYWEKITKNLSEFIKSGKISPDREENMQKDKFTEKEYEIEPKKNISYFLKMSKKILKERGIKALAEKIINYKNL